MDWLSTQRGMIFLALNDDSARTRFDWLEKALQCGTGAQLEVSPHPELSGSGMDFNLKFEEQQGDPCFLTLECCERGSSQSSSASSLAETVLRIPLTTKASTAMSSTNDFLLPQQLLWLHNHATSQSILHKHSQTQLQSTKRSLKESLQREQQLKLASRQECNSWMDKFAQVLNEKKRKIKSLQTVLKMYKQELEARTNRE
jgi:hypothetical protein